MLITTAAGRQIEIGTLIKNLLANKYFPDEVAIFLQRTLNLSVEESWKMLYKYA